VQIDKLSLGRSAVFFAPIDTVSYVQSVIDIEGRDDGMEGGEGGPLWRLGPGGPPSFERKSYMY